MINGKEKRSCYTIPLQIVIECQKKNYKNWKIELDKWMRSNNEIDDSIELYALLSPGDLVYMPTYEEIANGKILWNKNNVYKVVSFDNTKCYFVPHYVASSIIDKEEFTRHNKISRVQFIDGDNRLIKDYCIPFKTNRLGEISKV